MFGRKRKELDYLQAKHATLVTLRLTELSVIVKGLQGHIDNLWLEVEDLNDRLDFDEAMAECECDEE